VSGTERADLGRERALVEATGAPDVAVELPEPRQRVQAAAEAVVLWTHSLGDVDGLEQVALGPGVVALAAVP